MKYLLLLLLTGCATMDEIYDRSRWVYDGMETATYTWEVVQDQSRCGNFAPNAPHWGCALRVINSVVPMGAKPVPGATVKFGHCYIFSDVEEEDAKRIISMHGDDLWSHELRHCNGWGHPR